MPSSPAPCCLPIPLQTASVTIASNVVKEPASGAQPLTFTFSITPAPGLGNPIDVAYTITSADPNLSCPAGSANDDFQWPATSSLPAGSDAPACGATVVVQLTKAQPSVDLTLAVVPSA
jgi:hypothetical protein